MASDAPATGSPRQRSPTRSPQHSPRNGAAAAAPATPPPPQPDHQPDPAAGHEDASSIAPPEAPAAAEVEAKSAIDVSVAAAGEEEWPPKPPPERQLIKREVVRVEAAWLKRKKGNPNLNPRGFQVVCTLTGGVDLATAKKGTTGPPKLPMIKEQREPPPKSIAVDVKEYPDAYMFVADVPGFRNTDIKIDVVNDRFMTISCGRTRNDGPGVYYISLERTMGNFVRKFMLPVNSNHEAMKAGCQDGVLTIFVPMSPPAPEQVVRPSMDVAWDRRKSRG